MPHHIKLIKGLNIRIKGKVKNIFLPCVKSQWVALKPDDFKGVIPKLLLKPGDLVKAGTPVFCDKLNPEVKFASPVSGKVFAVNRGERRKILEIVIETDGKQEYIQHKISEIETLSRQNVIDEMLDNGLWAYIIQRPFGIIANHNAPPKAIFISGFDTAPLAPDIDFILKGQEENLQAGINILQKLTNGKIYVGINGKSVNPSIFEKIKGIEITRFSGPHPAGNVGIQIHHISPVNKGEIVWVIAPADVVIIGKYFSKGIYDVSRIIALTGSEVINTGYVKTVAGTQISFIGKNNLSKIEKRFISGNVLTGTTIPENGYLGFYHNMITVIPEGNYYEFLGWIMPGFKKFSSTRTFASWLTPKKEYTLDTNYHGAERAFVMTGKYEKVVPMDILPQHLIKAALIEDIELMENLGIYEVVEEDLALCEFVCTSKIEVQAILRKALDFVKKEMS
ncbi:MAG: NADH:ubiquinone reductase (Na(+)-transporting) subunit A [Bacteroidetes bacterium CG23_combo_of_CG06-09_8_20_14_all_32_9]|nr:MAG: NADH:ubiquinone reductase (Na(+)-transporting) subunit A [Bacteroidetes bacterium CG23_combo_of_CG06-09_8_20_14_all_32_9]